MCHLRDHVAFDEFGAGAVAPDLAHITVGRLRPRRLDVEAVHAEPLVDDFDGILGGAPANTFVPLLSEQTYNATQVTNPNNPNGFVPSSALAAVTNAVQAACANAKTVPTDNFLGNPQQCRPHLPSGT